MSSKICSVKSFVNFTVRKKPVNQCQPGFLPQALSVIQSRRRPFPAALWIAPSTPPPPSSEEFAAFPIASQAIFVISPCTILKFIFSPITRYPHSKRVGISTFWVFNYLVPRFFFLRMMNTARAIAAALTPPMVPQRRGLLAQKIMNTLEDTDTFLMVVS